MSSADNKGDKPIQLLVANERAYVWDIQGTATFRRRDVQRLRAEHHVCGILTGTLPNLGQQNVFLGLPLLLLPEEVVLLVRNKLAVLVDDVAAHRHATPQQAQQYAQQRERAIEAQITMVKQAEQAKQDAMADLIAQRRLEKQKKKQQLHQQQQQIASGSQDGQQQEQLEMFVPDKLDGSETTGPPPILSSSSPPKPPPSTAAAPSSYSVIIQPTSIDMSWYDPSAAIIDSLDTAKEIGLWHYPVTPLQQARCRVFEDLWRKGYFMGGGLRFGGDFLVYPGDSLRYHSHFTLTVLETPQATIMPMDLVAYGRLATAVKKAHLLACWNDETEQAEYFSLEWAAF
ncbi:tRNA-splicing endonuclease subunit [Microbotryomycetes sp. JL221]|nr:tRNA-splicing endonuclease subunit [Microbotryomycetes sp. JL221]